MTVPLSHPVREARFEDIPEGMIEYSARTAVRDLIRLHGYETARDLLAGYLNDEADRRPRQ